MPNKAKVSRAVLAMLALSFAVSWAHAQTPTEDHVVWCVQPAANSTLANQLGKGNCAAFLTGGLAAAYFSDNQKLLDIVLNATQQDMGIAAVAQACIGNPASDQLAIRLLTACQCHNLGAQNEIDSHQKLAIASLLSIGNTRKDLYAGACVAPRTERELGVLRK